MKINDFVIISIPETAFFSMGNNVVNFYMRLGASYAARDAIAYIASQHYNAIDFIEAWKKCMAAMFSYAPGDLPGKLKE